MWADLDSEVHLVQPNTKITTWLKASNKRIMKQLLLDKLFFLEGWTCPEVGPATCHGRRIESDFKIICPVASGHLPIRSGSA